MDEVGKIKGSSLFQPERRLVALELFDDAPVRGGERCVAEFREQEPLLIRCEPRGRIRCNIGGGKPAGELRDAPVLQQ